MQKRLVPLTDPEGIYLAGRVKSILDLLTRVLNHPKSAVQELRFMLDAERNELNSYLLRRGQTVLQPGDLEVIATHAEGGGFHVSVEGQVKTDVRRWHPLLMVEPDKRALPEYAYAGVWLDVVSGSETAERSVTDPYAIFAMNLREWLIGTIEDLDGIDLRTTARGSALWARLAENIEAMRVLAESSNQKFSKLAKQEAHRIGGPWSAEHRDEVLAVLADPGYAQELAWLTWIEAILHCMKISVSSRSMRSRIPELMKCLGQMKEQFGHRLTMFGHEALHTEPPRHKVEWRLAS